MPSPYKYNPFDFGMNDLMSDAGREVKGGMDYYFSKGEGFDKDHPLASSIINAIPGLGTTRQLFTILNHPEKSTIQDVADTTIGLVADMSIPLARFLNIPDGLFGYFKSFLKAKGFDDKALYGLFSTTRGYDNTVDWGG